MTGDQKTAEADANTERGPDEARAMAMRWLARRDYGRVELARRLVQRGISAEAAEAAVEHLAEHDYVSDRRFAETFARQRFERLQGARRIRAELKSRGIEAAEIALALEPFDGEWEAQALAWARRRHRGELDRRERARLYRAGLQRGFTHEQVMRAIDRLRDRGD